MQQLLSRSLALLWQAPKKTCMILLHLYHTMREFASRFGPHSSKVDLLSSTPSIILTLRNFSSNLYPYCKQVCTILAPKSIYCQNVSCIIQIIIIAKPTPCPDQRNKIRFVILTQPIFCLAKMLFLFLN